MSLSMKNMLSMFSNRLLASKNNAILHNRFVLYFIFFISLGNLFYLTMESDVFSIMTFVLIGFITSFFSKNMIVILVIALAMTNILKFGTDLRHETFGDLQGYPISFEEKEKEDKKEEDEEEKDKKSKEDESEK